MAVQTPGSITSEALLRLTDLHFNEKEAKLKAERASAIKSVEGRQMIPGVMAQLAELEQKKAQQKAKIAKQAEDQGVSQKSLLPPMTDVTGQTRGQVDTKAIGELAGQLLHKGGPQPAGQQGAALQGMGGTAMNAAGQAGLNMARAGVGQGINPNVPSPTSGQPAQTSPAGQENIFRQLGRVGLNMLGGRIGGVALGSEFLPEPPTQEEVAQSNAAQARTLAPGLSVLERRRRDPNPAVSGPAQQLYDKKMMEIEQINPGVAAESRRQGFDLYLTQEEEIRIRQEDPKYKVQRERAETAWGIEQKVIEGGIGSLTPGEREFYEGKKPGVTVNLPGAPTGAETGRMQGLLDQGRTAIQHLDSIEAAMAGTDWAFTAEGKADVGWLRLQKQSPLVFGKLKQEEDERIAQFTRVEQAVAAFRVPEIHELFGAALTPGEQQASEPLFPSMDKDLITNQTDLEQLRENYGLGLFRRELVLEKNQAIDPRFAMGLGNTKQAAIDAVMERTDEHVAAGLDRQAATARTEYEFKSRYGIDVKHLLGVITPGSQSRP